jgi:hypothetical protein
MAPSLPIIPFIIPSRAQRCCLLGRWGTGFRQTVQLLDLSCLSHHPTTYTYRIAILLVPPAIFVLALSVLSIISRAKLRMSILSFSLIGVRLHVHSMVIMFGIGH